MSGDVGGDDLLVRALSDSSPEFEDALLRCRSGALYDCMLVVDINSTGADILCLIVPEDCECLVEKARFGEDSESSCRLVRFDVKARARDILSLILKCFLLKSSCVIEVL